MSQTYKLRTKQQIKKALQEDLWRNIWKTNSFLFVLYQHLLQVNKTGSPSSSKKFFLILLILKSHVPICQGFRPRGLRECFSIDCSDSLIGNRSTVVLATHKIFVSTGKLKLCYFKTDCYSHENSLQFRYPNAPKSLKMQF